MGNLRNRILLASAFVLTGTLACLAASSSQQEVVRPLIETIPIIGVPTEGSSTSGGQKMILAERFAIPSSQDQSISVDVNLAAQLSSLVGQSVLDGAPIHASYKIEVLRGTRSVTVRNWTSANYTVPKIAKIHEYHLNLDSGMTVKITFTVAGHTQSRSFPVLDHSELSKAS
jgi:hypothetical protein